MPLEPGALLHNRYKIEKTLGQGGMGAVYLATDESLGLPCAVKENLNVSPDSERQFKREATLLASLRHHHLPRVTNHFVIGDQQYLVMDYVEGEDLKQRFTRQGPLPEADVLKWARQICDALTYLHGRTPTVIHRDIKPANIKLTHSGDAMLVDFGIAKSSAAGQRTTTGAAAFTPGFAPPEQYGMGRTDARTDEYALAATLYNLLSGETPLDSLERLMSGARLIPLDELRPGLAPHVGRALQRALEVKPEERYPSVAEFKAALEEEDDDRDQQKTEQRTRLHQAAPLTVRHEPAAPARPARLIPALIGGGLMVVAVGVAVVWFGGGGADLGTATPPPESTFDVVQPSSVFAAPARATATPSQAPLRPTETPTPEPPTDTPLPTVAGTPLGAGPRIAFISNRDGKFYQIYTMNPDGSDVQQLTFDERNKWDPNWEFDGTQLAWSSDGRRLLYVADGGGANGLDLWLMNADGTNQQDVTQLTGDDYQPAWCDNDTLAYTSNRSQGVQQIWTLTFGERPHNLSAEHNSPREWDAVWFPKCEALLFTTTVNGPLEIWRYFLDASSYRPVRSRAPDIADEAALSPDGKFIAYTLRAPGANEIISGLLADRFTDQQLTSSLGNSAAQWSPDGKWLVFISTRDGNREIYSMTSGGAAQTNLSRNSAVDTDPAWQPLPPQP